jgi:hypothetical protein
VSPVKIISIFALYINYIVVGEQEEAKSYIDEMRWWEGKREH